MAKRYWEIALNRGAYDYDDLISEGNFGLKHAAEKYTESMGEFSTYAFSCINGAILHFLRKIRSKRDSGNLSLDGPIGNTDLTLMNVIGEELNTNPLQYLNPSLKRAVQESLNTLPPIEREVIIGIYFQEMSPNEIGITLGISREQVMQKNGSCAKEA